MTCRRQRCTQSCIEDDDRLQGNNSGHRGRLGTAAVAARTVVAVGGALVAIRLAGMGRGRGATRRGSWALHVASGVLVSALGVRIEESGSHDREQRWSSATICPGWTFWCCPRAHRCGRWPRPRSAAGR